MAAVTSHENALLLVLACASLFALNYNLFPQLNLTTRPGGGGGGTWVKFYWVCAAGTSGPLPHYSLFLVYFVAKYRAHLSHFWVL